MQKVSRPRDKRRNVVFGCVGLLVILVDQLSKIWIRDNLAIGQSLSDVGFFRLFHVQNTGAAWGLFQDHTFTLIIVDIISIAIVLFLAFFLRNRWSFLDSLLVWSGIGMIIGGTIGNLIDRLHLGYVTDFIDFKVWPVWNVADASTVVGCIIIAYCIIFLYRPAKYKE